MRVFAQHAPPAASPRRRQALSVALLGLSEFERRQFETVFRLASREERVFRCVDRVESADVFVVNGDDAQALQRLREERLLPLSVLIGGPPLSAAAVQLPRPIDIAQIVRALEPLALDEAPPSAMVQRVLDDLASVSGAPLDDLGPAGPAVLVAGAVEATLRPALQALREARAQVQRVRNAADAIERARSGAFELVLIDAALDGLDGWHACRRIKQQAASASAPPTVLMLVSGPLGVSEVRAEQAGADAVLTVPVRSAVLAGWLAQRV